MTTECNIIFALLSKRDLAATRSPGLLLSGMVPRLYLGVKVIGSSTQSGAIDSGDPAPGLKVMNATRIKQIDELLAWIIQLGNGKLILEVKDGRYRFIEPCPHLNAER